MHYLFIFFLLMYASLSTSAQMLDSCAMPPIPRQWNFGTKVEFMPTPKYQGKPLGITTFAVAAPDDIVAIYTQNLCTNIMRSRDTGRTWEMLLYRFDISKDEFGHRINAIAHPTKNSIIAVGDTGSVFTSTDAGVTWLQQKVDSVSFIQTIVMLDSMNGIIGNIVGKVLLRTTDGGITWHEFENIPKTYGGEGLGMTNQLHHPDKNNILIPLPVRTQLDTPRYTIKTLRTTNAGASWYFSDYRTNATAADLFTMRGKDSITLCSFFRSPSDPLSVYSLPHLQESFDGGLTWCNRIYYDPTPWEARRITSLAFSPSRRLLAGSADYLFYWSPDNGKTWIHDTTNKKMLTSSGVPTLKMVALSDTLIIGSNANRFFRLSLPKKLDAILTDIREASGTNGELLSNIRPNPADDNATITVEAQSVPHVEIIDILGNSVATPSLENDSSPYIFRWNTRAFAGGIFFARITNEKSVSLQRIIIMR